MSRTGVVFSAKSIDLAKTPNLIVVAKKGDSKFAFLKDALGVDGAKAVEVLLSSVKSEEKEKTKKYTILVGKQVVTLIVVYIDTAKVKDVVCLEKTGNRIFDSLNCINIERAGLVVSDVISLKNITSEQAILHIAFGIVQKSYRFDKYLGFLIKDKEKAKDDGRLTHFIELEITDKNKSLSKEWNKELSLILDALFTTRDLVNEPANIINPETFVKHVKHNLSSLPVKITVLGEKEMTQLGMHCLLGVGKGSDIESQTVIVEYIGNPSKKGFDLALVGKGVTFDSGGLSLKPAEAMEDMKGDMAGAAAVFASIELLAKRKAKVNVIAAMGLVENMVNGSAQKPGDIVKSMSGQTVEVLNTDAEGRLVLSDVLYYVTTKYNPEYVVDAATLTGAIVVALGFYKAGLYANDEKLLKLIQDAGEKSGDSVWHMPLGDEYDALLNSKIADMKNITGQRGGGSITAAHFLKRFVGKTKWAHIDIAGVSGEPDRSISSTSAWGATGFGVKLFNELARSLEAKK